MAFYSKAQPAETSKTCHNCKHVCLWQENGQDMLDCLMATGLPDWYWLDDYYNDPTAAEKCNYYEENPDGEMI